MPFGQIARYLTPSEESGHGTARVAAAIVTDISETARRLHAAICSACTDCGARRYILRITVTTRPRIAASLPGIGSKAGLCGINHT
jgi:hypothetical protein